MVELSIEPVQPNPPRFGGPAPINRPERVDPLDLWAIKIESIPISSWLHGYFLTNKSMCS